MGRMVLAAGLVVVVLGCRGPRVEYEYEKPVTITSGGGEPDLFTPTTTTTLPPAPPPVWRRGEKQ